MWRERPYYYLIVLLFILSGLVAMLFWDKGDAVLRLNGLHTSSADLMFRNITMLGEWIGGVLIGALLLLTREYRFLLTFLIAIGLSSGIAQLLKTQVFDEHDRPAVEYQEELEPVQYVRWNKHYSFPSGHTTAAFCIFTIAALSFRNRWAQLGFASLACLVGISRMYLGQHYLMDVVAGAILGTVMATWVFQGLIDKWGTSWARNGLR